MDRLRGLWIGAPRCAGAPYLAFGAAKKGVLQPKPDQPSILPVRAKKGDGFIRLSLIWLAIVAGGLAAILLGVA